MTHDLLVDSERTSLVGYAIFVRRKWIVPLPVALSDSPGRVQINIEVAAQAADRLWNLFVPSIDRDSGICRHFLGLLR
jgi:hypothetical protein